MDRKRLWSIILTTVRIMGMYGRIDKEILTVKRIIGCVTRRLLQQLWHLPDKPFVRFDAEVQLQPPPRFSTALRAVSLRQDDLIAFLRESPQRSRPCTSPRRTP